MSQWQINWDLKTISILRFAICLAKQVGISIRLTPGLDSDDFVRLSLVETDLGT